MKCLICFLLLFSINNLSFSQITIGNTVNSELSTNGYTLFTSDKSTYLIDNCGKQINKWTSNYLQGQSVYLHNTGNLYRAGSIPNDSIEFLGIGGIIERWDWNGNLLWQFKYSTPTYSQHHDFQVMPNGNVLLLVLERKSKNDAIQKGRKPEWLIDNELYNEKIVEIKPTGKFSGEVVWEWSLWDHLIQDEYEELENFSVIKNNPRRLNINYLGNDPNQKGFADWTHMNALHYNSLRDEIIICSQRLSEFYIIDHSTTIEQAKSSSGGNKGHGGDFLYRFGNRKAYDHGSAFDQLLFGAHNPTFISENYVGSGNILIFNNGLLRQPIPYSSVCEIELPINSQGNYELNSEGYFGPEEFVWEFKNDDQPDQFYSQIVSGAQRLPNGHTLICEGTKGRLFEINENKEVIWEYINPLTASGEIMSQGQLPTPGRLFRGEKYLFSDQIFNNIQINIGLPIELNPDLSNCNNSIIENPNDLDLLIYPNPSTGQIKVLSEMPIKEISVFNSIGQEYFSITDTNQLDLSNYVEGLYFIRIKIEDKTVFKSIIISRN